MSVAAAGARQLDAQSLEAWLDATAAHARPPGDATQGQGATFGLLGVRLRASGARRGMVEFAGQAGSSAETAGGTWLNGNLAADLGGFIGRALVGGRLETFLLDYSDPFAYRAYGIAVHPRVARTLGAASATVRATLTRGGWRTELEPSDPPIDLPIDLPGSGQAESVTGRLAVTGGALELGRPLGRAWIQLAAEGYHARNGSGFDGWYGGGTLSVSVAGGRIDGFGGGRLWSTPDGADPGYFAGLGVALTEGLRAQLQVGRSVRDPLYGTAGSFAASLGLSWRVGGGERARAPVAEIGERSGQGRRVRFRLRAEHASEVSLAGDFTGWTPRPMQSQDGTWALDLVLAPGLHHFAFLVDGERWVVPDEAPGVVEDGWGRRNASIVVTE